MPEISAGGRYEARVTTPGVRANVQVLAWNPRLEMVEIRFPSGSISRHISHARYALHWSERSDGRTALFDPPDPAPASRKTELRANEWTNPLGQCVAPFREEMTAAGERRCVVEDGEFSTAYEYSGSLPAGGGASLPRVARRVNRQGKELQSFEFLSADFATSVADDEILPEWFRPGVSVVDSRLGLPVGWTYEEIRAGVGRGSDVTPDALLELTRARVAEFAATRRAAKRAENPRDNRVRWEGPATVFAGVLFIGLVLWAWRSRR